MNDWKIFLIALAAVGVLIISNVVHIRIEKDLRAERDQVITFARRDSAAAQDYLNKFSHQVRRTEETELTLRNARQLAGTERLAFLRELQGVKSNLKNLEAAVSLQTRTAATVQAPSADTIVVVKGDTIHTHKFGYVDEFNSIRGLLIGDTTLVHVTINTPIYGAVYWQRSRILGLRIGRKNYFAEFTTPNSWVRITGAESIKIQRRN